MFFKMCNLKTTLTRISSYFLANTLFFYFLGVHPHLSKDYFLTFDKYIYWEKAVWKLRKLQALISCVVESR